MTVDARALGGRGRRSTEDGELISVRYALF